MLPSSTVENYLKVIFQQQIGLPDDGLVPMGQVASAVGVTPGTATTMVKTLAESGLLQYEPYIGVRLTAAGERLAALVLRRHRLVELFLVQVMGMSWDEVHEEAEQLEHVVSERLIERMDEMLGRPQVDPHGDPIPNADGSVEHRELLNLLTCPVGVPVTVTRVADQDASFLRFLENSNLKPGQQLRVEARDPAADSVRVRGGDDDATLTLGARAASKLLVEIATLLLLVLFGAPPSAAAQTSPDAPPEPFAITDNSFFVEEAFNQEPRVFQNIGTVVRDGDDGWALQFTQEWPAPSLRHQVSYSVAVLHAGHHAGPGDVALTYRYQLWEERPGRPAFSPRLSALVPMGDESHGHGGSWGWQANLPLSKQLDDFYVHGNAGVTWQPRVPVAALDTGARRHVALTSPFLAGSVIYRAAPMFNVLLEGVVDWQQEIAAEGRTLRHRTTILSPGVRGGWNLGEKQVVVGAAVPVTRAARDTSVGLLAYVSYELPF